MKTKEHPQDIEKNSFSFHILFKSPKKNLWDIVNLTVLWSSVNLIAFHDITFIQRKSRNETWEKEECCYWSLTFWSCAIIWEYIPHEDIFDGYAASYPSNQASMKSFSFQISIDWRENVFQWSSSNYVKFAISGYLKGNEEEETDRFGIFSKKNILHLVSDFFAILLFSLSMQMNKRFGFYAASLSFFISVEMTSILTMMPGVFNVFPLTNISPNNCHLIVCMHQSLRLAQNYSRLPRDIQVKRKINQ